MMVMITEMFFFLLILRMKYDSEKKTGVVFQNTVCHKIEHMYILTPCSVFL